MKKTITVTVEKPRIRLLKDEYAIETGRIWACSNSIFVARGETPLDAYENYYIHMDRMRSRNRKMPYAQQPVRA